MKTATILVGRLIFGFFVDHFTFIAGLLFAAVHGPGDTLALSPKYAFRRT